MSFEKIINFIWNEFVYGGHITAFAALSVVLTASVILSINIRYDFLIIIYLGIYLVYFFNRYKEYKIDYLSNINRSKHLKKYFSKIPYFLLFFFLVFFFFVIFYSSLNGIVFTFLLLFLGIAYSLFFKKLTKIIIGFKSLYISFMWSFLIIFLIYYHSLEFNVSVFLLFLFVFLRMFIHTSFFDIKDIEIDKGEGLLTLPVKMKEKEFIYLLNFISIASLIPLFIGVLWGKLPVFSLSLIATFFFSFFYLKNYKKYKNNLGFFSQVVISGEKIFWLLIILIGKFIF